MRSLFVKTLLWFVGTAFITMTAIVLVAAINFNSGDRRQPPFGMLLTLQLSDARAAYETGGKEALQKTLDRITDITQAEAALTDAEGTDLLTGEDRSDLIKVARRNWRIPFIGRSRTVVARRSDDGRYWYVLFVNRANWITWFVQPAHHMIVLALLVLLCYAFARHLTNPVKRLQEAVDCFGRGDFKTRVNVNRGDELGQLGRTFNQMADRIETLLAAERRLLQDISHELRSPLARLSVAVELARSGGDQESQLNRIQKEADRLNDLVGQLLQVTRAEADPSNRKLDQVRLDELVREVVEDCRIEADARGCTLTLQSPRALNVAGDSELLRRAVENVVRNAIRHAPPGTAVDIALREDSGSIAIAVRDQGPGVPEEALVRIFDPFYRVESDRNRMSGGVGLGLSIARRAVELHKGRIWARNVQPGLMVEIDLPTVA